MVPAYPDNPDYEKYEDKPFCPFLQSSLVKRLTRQGYRHSYRCDVTLLPSIRHHDPGLSRQSHYEEDEDQMPLFAGK